MKASPMAAGEFAGRLRKHVRCKGRLTAPEWVQVLMAPRFLASDHGAETFASTTFDVKGGRLLVSETRELL